MTPRIRPYLLTLFTLLLCVSCAEEQDFGVFNELRAEPEVEASLFFLRTTEQLINDFGGSNVVYEQFFEFEAFSEEFVNDRILQGTIFYEIENSTSKPLLLEVLFLDEGGNLLDTETFNILALENLERQVFYGNGGKPLTALAGTAQLLVRVVNQGDTSSVSPEPGPELIFRSHFQVSLRLL